MKTVDRWGCELTDRLCGRLRTPRRCVHVFLLAILALPLTGADSTTGSEVRPPNDLPNPYRTVAPWGNLPDGRKWGALNGVDIDRDGVSVWVADRCGANPDAPSGTNPFQYDSCAGSKLPAVLEFDASGKLLTSFGAGMFIFPHKDVRRSRRQRVGGGRPRRQRA